MKSTLKRTKILIAFAFAFMAGLIFLAYTFFSNGSEYVFKPANRHLYSSSVLANSGKIFDKNGIILVQTVEGKRVFNESEKIRKATLHAVGDNSSYIATGVQNNFRSELTGFNLIWGVSAATKRGGNNIELTLNADLCALALDELRGKNGVVGVYNYKTGEIVCMVSTPTFDINNKPSEIDSDETGKYTGIYMNKLFSGLYVPGSVFKIVTAAAAIEAIPDILTRDFNCTGEYKTVDGVVKCSSTHGSLNFEKAFNVSCNAVFALIANEIGSKKISDMADMLGLTNSLYFDKVKSSKGIVNLLGANSADLGWASIGQYTIMCNPLSIMTMMGAIANGGNAVRPYFVSEIKKSDGSIIYSGNTVIIGRYLNLTTSNILKSLLRSNVVNYYGNNILKRLEICAKTGTAELGGALRPHSWFTGFSQSEAFPYAFVVVVENGGSGLNVAAPVAANVLNALEKLDD